MHTATDQAPRARAALAAGLVIALAALTGAPADAYVFSPPSTAFTGSGSMKVIGPTHGCETCAYTITGRVTASGTITLTGMQFSDPLIQAAGLPWTWKAKTASGGNVLVHLIVDGTDCGATTHRLGDASGFLYIFPKYRPCIIGAGGAQTTPAILVAP